MTESVVDSIYGAKMASTESLIALAAEGSDFARQELRHRLPNHVDELLRIYLAAYPGAGQSDAAVAALEEIKRTVGTSND
ncbi:hypothetical protein [Advenella mimigardefordensis]|uniref:Uncharacterized protein n=1 Tax=Advenella mimigardefordensis (strain DSM 17166 / LMG 22922 / DPN7) TaxID=1247726 RepID=W0PCW3_ADVMD|nr:hypothetical protein [Advenella mimigardefordensis]AHG62878.1 hypothetical protein MIM_c07790 [Advenella mimigardefordensis DPN7]